MSVQDPQLVAEIAAAVLRELRTRGLTPSADGVNDRGSGAVTDSAPQTQESAGHAKRAEIHPPIGVCTGDYSKFPELRGRAYGGASVEADAASPKLEPMPLTGIITAEQLRAAMAASADGVAIVSAGARLTPLANDFARERPEHVRRVSESVSTNHNQGATPRLPWMTWCDGRCPAVDLIEHRHTARLRPTVAQRDPAAVAQVVRDLAAAVRGGRVAGGLLFVATAARAMCFANRCNSLRAVLGTCDEAVQQGIDELGANVLVVEFPHIGRRAMIAMVDRMLAGVPQAPSSVQRTLAELHRCE